MKKDSLKSKRVWLIMTGFSCNNNCVMCSTKPKSKNYSDRTSEEIQKDLLIGKEKGYQRVEFTGGEVTIRSDILSLVEEAKKLNYSEIAFSTNGRMLSYDPFCKKAIENGLNRVTFTLCADNSHLGQAITRTPQSFEQTIKGIKNIKKHSFVDVSVNTVPIKPNYQHLLKIGKLLLSLGVDTWNILDLIPDGYGLDFYEILAVKMGNLNTSFSKLRNIAKDFKLISFFDFPMCIFPEDFHYNKHINFITAKGRIDIEKQVGYKPQRFKRSKDDIYEDVHKKRIKICSKCKFFKSCGGIWKNYIDLYGKNEVSYLVNKNNCLIEKE